MGSVDWVGAAEEVVVGFVRATLQRTAAQARFEELELLDLKQKDLIDPFCKALLLGKGEGQ